MNETTVTSKLLAEVYEWKEGLITSSLLRVAFPRCHIVTPRQVRLIRSSRKRMLSRSDNVPCKEEAMLPNGPSCDTKCHTRYLGSKASVHYLVFRREHSLVSERSELADPNRSEPSVHGGLRAKLCFASAPTIVGSFSSQRWRRSIEREASLRVIATLGKHLATLSDE